MMSTKTDNFNKIECPYCGEMIAEGKLRALINSKFFRYIFPKRDNWNQVCYFCGRKFQVQIRSICFRTTKG